jgi:WD40 repeat protein
MSSFKNIILHFYTPRFRYMTSVFFLFFAVSVAGCSASKPAVTETNIITPTSLTTRVAATQSVPISATKFPTYSPEPLLSPVPTKQVFENITSQNVSRLELLAQLSDGDFTRHIAISPDSKTLAVGTTTGILFFDAVTGKKSFFWPLPAPVAGLAFSPDGAELAATYLFPGKEVYSGGTFIDGATISEPVISVWKLSDGALAFKKNTAGSGCGDYHANHLTYSPDGKYIAFDDAFSLKNFGRSQRVCLLSTADGSLLRMIELTAQVEGDIVGFAFSPDNQTIIVADMAGNVFLIKTSDGSIERHITASSSIGSLAFSSDGQWFITIDGDSVGELWSVSDSRSIRSLKGSNSEVISVAVSPDGKWIATGSVDGVVSLWNTADGTLQQSLVALTADNPIRGPLTAGIWSLAFSPDGMVLFAVGDTYTVGYPVQVQAWRVADGQALYNLAGRRGEIKGSFSPDSQLFACGGSTDGSVQVWRTLDGGLAFELLGHTSIVNQVVFSPDGKLIASASDDGTLRLWDAYDGTALQVLTGHAGAVLRAAFSPDSTTVASSSTDDTLRIWRVVDGGPVKVHKVNSNGQVNSLWFIERASKLLYSLWCYTEACWQSADTRTWLWDLETDQASTLLDTGMFGLAFDANQSHAAYLSSDGLQTSTLAEGLFLPVRTYQSPMGNGGLGGVALSPDGSLIVSGNGFGIHIWDWAAGELLAVVGQEQTDWGLYGEYVFSPDARLITISSSDAAITLWGIRP